MPARTRIAVAVTAVLLAACNAPSPNDARPATEADKSRPTVSDLARNGQAQTPPAAPVQHESRATGTAQPSPAIAGTLGYAAQKSARADTKMRDRLSLARTQQGGMARPGVHPPMRPPMSPQVRPEANERYQSISENPVKLVSEAPVSTFSIDVDTGSYANLRRFLASGRLPPADAVRVEEMINYFPYDYAQPEGDTPFAVHTDVAAAPWNESRLLVRVAVKGRDVAAETLPPANLVFLVDVSGSMHSANKLPLLQSALKLLVGRLRDQDRISLVTYAGATRVVLDSVPGSDKARIVDAIDALRSGGSTAGASGIELAYRTARRGFIEGGINRILLATDGDFNVGVTSVNALEKMVETNRKTGISLSTLGFGTGNYNEHLMERIADVGDGAYSYIDTLMEAQKVLVTEMSSTLATIARDVKIQVEFNPAAVSEYRLIGYENRMLRREDFNNDKVDAGDIGAGHTVTALYEITPVGARGRIDPLRYGARPPRSTEIGKTRAAAADELAFVKLRYKRPGETASRLIERPLRRTDARPVASQDVDFRFATAVAGFGQILRGGRYTGEWKITDARALAASGVGKDRFGYRAEALRLMDLAAAITPRVPRPGVRVRPTTE